MPEMTGYDLLKAVKVWMILPASSSLFPVNLCRWYLQIILVKLKPTSLSKKRQEQTCPRPIPVVIMSSENEPQRISRSPASFTKSLTCSKFFISFSRYLKSVLVAPYWRYLNKAHAFSAVQVPSHWSWGFHPKASSDKRCAEAEKLRQSTGTSGTAHGRRQEEAATGLVARDQWIREEATSCWTGSGMIGPFT